MLLQLPFELLSDILTLCLDNHPCPSNVLCVHSQLHAIGIHILCSRLHFRSVRQLTLFAQSTTPLPCAPRELLVTLAGGTADFLTFRYLGNAIRRCVKEICPTTREPDTCLPLELLSLRLNSHTSNPNLPDICSSLALVNPKTFVWIGPDPGHHFSTAIVPAATFYLFQAMFTWTAVEHVKLANIAFPSYTLRTFLPSTLDSEQHVSVFSTMPSLRTLYIGQATFLPPNSIAAMICLEEEPQLDQIRLVDTYEESIWGRRIRRTDIEKAALEMELMIPREVALERIRRIVKCEAQNERVIGGDRAEGLVLLE